VKDKQSLLNDLALLTKLRLTFLVIVTTFIGFFLGSTGGINWLLLFNVLLGTFLAACGAAVLNQYIEMDLDGLMDRTKDRPLPTKRMQPVDALRLGVILAVGGSFYLLITVNLLTCFLSALTLILYLFLYTPMKRKTYLSTFVGAIPGAIPPVMGWTAVQNNLSIEAWVLFAILFVWQLPHFFAISWMYRSDFKRAGFPLLGVIDETGNRMGKYMMAFLSFLIVVTVLPSSIEIAGSIYFYGALILGVCFLGTGVNFARQKTDDAARIVFFASIIYLPLLLSLLVFNRI